MKPFQEKQKWCIVYDMEKKSYIDKVKGEKRIMGTFFEDFGKKVSETAETVTAKAGEAMEIQKLKVQKHALERVNEEDLAEIGRIIYEQYKAGDTLDSEMKAFCEAVEHREKIIQEFARKLRVLKGDKTCCSCGSMLTRDMAYCPYCGEKRESTAEKTCMKEKAEKVMEKAEEFAEKAVDKVKETAETVKEKVEKQAEEVKEKASDVADKTAEAVEEAGKKAADKMRDLF